MEQYATVYKIFIVFQRVSLLRFDFHTSRLKQKPKLGHVNGYISFKPNRTANLKDFSGFVVSIESSKMLIWANRTFFKYFKQSTR